MALNQAAQELISVMKNEDYEKLVDLASKNKSKKSPYMFKDAMKNLNSNEVDKLWDMLNRMVVKKAEVLFETSKNTNNGSRDKETCTKVNQVLQAAIDLASVVFEESMPVSQDLLQMVVFLNGIIFEIPSSIEALKNNIAHLCEKMFHLNYVNLNQYFTYNAVIYLLKRTLIHKAKKIDVKRVYAMRSMIPKILEMEEVDSNDVWDLLKKCAVSTLYLSMPEGQKIIALALTISVDYVASMHEVIKPKLLSCSVQLGITFGKIYFEAYSYSEKTNAENLKNKLELVCIQDIILSLIHSRNKSVVLVLQKMLGQFHYQKKEAYVSKMLCSLYQPILWRFLKNPDGLLRSNAAQLFLDVFPIEDPDVKIVKTDQDLNEQLLMIKDLLLDDFPIVRSTAIIGTCIAMSVNWELFPEEMLRTYFKIIVNDLSCDSSSADVRCSVAKGLKVLLENPLTLPTLQGVLPKLQGLFHDIADCVRIAFCQLLLRVKKISAIKYYDIVPLDHLLARLEDDSATHRLIVNLLHNSYFPKRETPQNWLARSLELIKADRAASRTVFKHIPDYVGLEATVRYMAQAVRSVHCYVKAKVSAKKICVLSRRSNLSKLNKTVTAYEGAYCFDDPNILAGLFDAVIIMWHAISSAIRKPENKCWLKMLVGKLAKYLGDLSLYYKDASICESIYFLSSYLPVPCVPTLGSLCFHRLKTLPSDACTKDYMTLLECLCNQNQSFQLLTLLKEWIEVGFYQSLEVTPLPKKRKVEKSEKNKSSQDTFLPKPQLAAQMLSAMLNHRVCQKAILTRHPETLREFINFTDIMKERIEEFELKPLNEPECSFLKDLLFALLILAVLLHGQEEFDSIKYVEDLVMWFEKNMKILTVHLDSNPNPPKRKSGKEEENIEESNSFGLLIAAICKGLCFVTADMTLLGYVDTKTCVFLKYAIKVLESDSGPLFLLPICKFLMKHISHGEYIYLTENGDLTMLEPVPEFFHRVLGCLNDVNFLTKIPEEDVKELQVVLATVLQMMHNQSLHGKELCDIFLEIVKCITNSILEDSNCVQLFKESYEPLDKVSVPKPCEFLLGMMCVNYEIFTIFLKELYNWCIKSMEVKESLNEDHRSWVVCCVILSHISRIKSISKNVLRGLGAVLVELEKILLKWYPVKESENVDENFLNLILDEEYDLEPITDITVELQPKEELSVDKHYHSEFEKLKHLLSQKTCNLKNY